MPHPLRHPLLCALLAASCGRAPSTQTPVSQGDIVARVNGVAIDRAEVSATSREGSPHGGGAPESTAASLETVVFEELLAQRAVARGLHRDPVFTAEYRRAEARLRQRAFGSACSKRRRVREEAPCQRVGIDGEDLVQRGD